MDIYKRLTADHDKQRELAKLLADTSGDSQERRRLFDEFKIELESHANAEEQTLYATLIEMPDGQEKAQHSVAEHKELTDLIEELEDMDMSSSGWLQKFKQLKHDVLHHVDEEEDDVFVLARKLIDEDKAVALADKFDQRKTMEKS